MSTVSLSAQSLVEVLTIDDTVSEFFQEELDSLPRSRDSDIASVFSIETRPSNTSALYSLRQSFSRLSLDSLRFENVQRFPLRELCQFILDNPSLRTAGITSCSCYRTPSAVFFVPHRFLILKLSRYQRRDVWLRLDRLRSPDVGLVELALALGSTDANDWAAIASSPDDLLTPKSVEESRLAFETPYLLSKFRQKLLDLTAVMKRYKVTSENCWAFCSLLLGYFTEEDKVEFEKGRLRHPGLARQAKRSLSDLDRSRRDNIAREREVLCQTLAPLAPILSPDNTSAFKPFSILISDYGLTAHSTTSLHEPTINGIRYHHPPPPDPLLFQREVDQAMDAARYWEKSTSLSSPEGLKLAGEMVLAFDQLPIYRIWDIDVDPNFAQQVTALSRHVAFEAASQAGIGPKVIDGCSSLLYKHGCWCLERKDYDKALPLFEHSVSLMIPEVTENWRAYFAYYAYALTLDKAGRQEEAKEAVLLFIESNRRNIYMSGWKPQMVELQELGLWPAEFDYLIHLGKNDLPSWGYWRKDRVDSEP